MAEMLVMRRANGDLFTEEVNQRTVIPVWSSRDAVARYRERNPELLTYLPARLNDALLRRIRQRQDAHATFFLMSEDAPDANLKRGRVVAFDELVFASNLASPPATAQG